jgi:uracil permease
MSQIDILRPHDRPTLGKWIPLSFQHVFAMFGATILVPILTGLDPAIALFTAGTGTLLFILCTGAKVPAFLGSSFTFIAPLIAISSIPEYGISGAMGGAMAAGFFYCVVALIIKFTGTGWIDRALPPVVIGSVIIVIGLYLAPTAMNMAMYDAGGSYSLVCLSIAAFTLCVAVACNIFLKGFLGTIPILIALVAGYIFTLIMGFFFPAFDLINFDKVKETAWFAYPTFRTPTFHIMPMLVFIIVSIATICEHLGDMVVTSKIVGQDFYKNPGLHRTLTGDGLASAWAALWGGPPNTTYSENVGVMAITRVYSVWVIGGAAVIAIFISFFSKFGEIIKTIPSPVLGGICILLFGIIASSGLRTIVEKGVDFKDKRNLIITSVILSIGIGRGIFEFNITDKVAFKLEGIALATVVGIILNLLYPKSKDV